MISAPDAYHTVSEICRKGKCKWENIKTTTAKKNLFLYHFPVIYPLKIILPPETYSAAYNIKQIYYS